jgi:regulator of sigma E protease
MEFNERAEAIGFCDGDILLHTDKTSLKRFDGDLYRAIAEANTITVLRDGNETIVNMPEEFSLFDLQKDAQPFVQFLNPMVLDSVTPQGAAARAGLIKGDHIQSINDTPATTWITFSSALNQLRQQEQEGAIINHDLTVVYRRGEVIDTTIVPTDANFMMGVSVALPYTPAKEEYGFFASIPAGIAYGWNTLKGYVSDLKYVFTKEGATSIGGFGTIGSLFPAQWNWYSFWSMTAFISIMLAFMNILPIPALDGGHVLILLYEVITRRKPSDRFLEITQTIGMYLLLALMAFAIFNDCSNLGVF